MTATTKLTRDEIVAAYTQLLGADNVNTDEQVLKDNSVDRYYKVENVFGIYSLPLPPQSLRLGQQLKLLRFSNLRMRTASTSSPRRAVARPKGVLRP